MSKPTYPIVEALRERREFEAANMLEFLLLSFQMYSPQMDGQHSYRFRNGGWPMTHLKGPSIEDAVRAAMEGVAREHIENISTGGSQ